MCDYNAVLTLSFNSSLLSLLCPSSMSIYSHANMRSNSSIFHILSLIGCVSAHLLPSSGDKDLLFCCMFLWLIQLAMALAWIYKHTQWFECFIKFISLKSFEHWCSCSKINRQAKVAQGKKYQKIKKMKTAHFRDHPWKWNEMEWHVL